MPTARKTRSEVVVSICQQYPLCPRIPSTGTSGAGAGERMLALLTSMLIQPPLEVEVLESVVGEEGGVGEAANTREVNFIL
jgi:hypothetical protein